MGVRRQPGTGVVEVGDGLLAVREDAVGTRPFAEINRVANLERGFPAGVSGDMARSFEFRGQDT